MSRRRKPLNQFTLKQLDELLPDEDACAAYLARRRWPERVRCPRCGSDRVYALATMKSKWECSECNPKGYRFSHLVGTIFENTNYPLKTWFRVIYMMVTRKKGISALQVHRMIGSGSYRTAWYMCKRIKAGLASDKPEVLARLVEFDESSRGSATRDIAKVHRASLTR